MALSPLTPIDTQAEATEVTTPAPSKTYRLGTDSIGGLIDGEEALRQFIRKAIQTARYRFLIYTDQYGSELESLVGEDVSAELLQAEIPRLVREALIYDDRIDDVVDFEISRDSDKVYVAFHVVTADGLNITEEVTLNGDF